MAWTPTVSRASSFSGQVITHFETRRAQGIQPLQPTIDSTAPLFHVRRDCPPMLILSGDREKELYGRYEETALLLAHDEARWPPRRYALRVRRLRPRFDGAARFAVTREFIKAHLRR